MHFAEPNLCPDCRGPIVVDRPVCERCGLDLRDPDLRELWQNLLHADELLARATARRDAARIAAPAFSPTPAPAEPSDPFSSAIPAHPAPAPPQPTVRTGPSWSPGTVLLGLGAIGLVVAAIIFVSRSWDSIGLVGKALVLGAATAAAVAAAAWVTRRPLRASGEALWAVALALLALDLIGARAEGLFGLDAVSWAWAVAVSGAVIVGAGAAVIGFARPHLSADLVTPAAGVTVGLAMAAVGASQIADIRPFWQQFVGLLVAGGLGLALRSSRSRLVAIGARIVVGLYFATAAVYAVVETFDNASLSQLVGEAHGLPLLLMSLAALGVAAAIASVRAPMTALAVIGLGLLVVVPAGDAWEPEGGFIAVAALAVVVAAAGLRGSTAWSTGIRFSVIPGGAVLLGLAAWWLVDATAVAATAVDRGPDLDLTDRAGGSVGSLDPVATVVCAVALVAVPVLLARWPGTTKAPWLRVAAPVAAAVLAAYAVSSTLDAPWWLIALVQVVGALAAWVLARRTGSLAVWIVGVVSAVLALCTSTAGQPLTAAVWVVIGVACVSLMLLETPVAVRRTAAAAAMPLVVGGVATGVDAAGGSTAATVLTALVFAATGVAAATRTSQVPRPFLESGAAATLGIAAVSADSTSLAAVCWTIVGVVLLGVAMTSADRRWYAWPGIAALVVAYVLLVIDSGFSFVEAYTLPLAAVALGAGGVLLARRPATSSWIALGPGLALGLLPSVPQGLADPTGLRALLLGLAAVVVLGIGVWLGRQAPFLLGAGVALLVVLFNVGPYANAAPRVLVISIVSVVLVALGITWEDRVRDGRRVMAFVKEMT